MDWLELLIAFFFWSAPGMGIVYLILCALGIIKD